MKEINLPSDFSGVHFHLVGIKGTGMAALAEILSERGGIITGSDVSETFYTDEVLKKIGVSALPFSEKNITDSVQFVIHSSAYSADKNPDLAQAAKKGLPTLIYSEALGAVSKTAYSCGVCGVHGKTTTTGLCGTLLLALDLPAQTLAGSVISSFGKKCTVSTPSLFEAKKNGETHFFVAETCEYQKHFMAFCPKKIILTSVESDHQDFYPTYTDIRDAFVDYCLKLPKNGELIFCIDDAGAAETAKIVSEKRPDITLIPYGTSAEGDFNIQFGAISSGRQHFFLSGFGEFSIAVPGAHNVRNATAAIALSIRLLLEKGKNPLENMEKIRAGLLSFSGGARRSEIVGRAKTPLGEEVIFIDDYAHHPTAIKTTLSGFRSFYKNHRIVVDFMSHTYSRTAALLNEFANSFSDANDVIINKIYASAREDASKAGVSGELLAQKTAEKHERVFYAGEFDDATETALNILSKKSGEKDGYLFVTMGAGDNWKVGKNVLERLQANGGEQ